MRVLLYETAYARLRERIAALPGAIDCLVIGADRVLRREGAPLALEDARADAIWAAFEVFAAPGGQAFFSQLLAAARPAWVHSAAAGYDRPIFAEIVASGATLTTSHGQAVGMAEYVLASVLDYFQGGPARRAAQARAEWKRAPYREISQTTWLIIGFGAIGQAVAQRARAFGAHVIGVRRNQAAHADAHEIAALADIPALLPRADVVVLCAPLTAQTRGLADAAFFAAMKAGSVIVNVGRGALIDEAALIAALDAGAPAHAVLDVFEVEPLPASHRFWTHPRVTVTPHASPMSDCQQARNDALFLENLRRYVAREPLLNVAAPADVLSSSTA